MPLINLSSFHSIKRKRRINLREREGETRSTRGGVRAQSGINFSRGTNAITHQDNNNTPTKKNPILEDPQKSSNKYEGLKKISINWNLEEKLGSSCKLRWKTEGRKIREETKPTANGRLASFLWPSLTHLLLNFFLFG